MAKLIKIEGIGPSYAEKLDSAGISTTEELLNNGATATGRKEIATKTGITETKILEWVNHADLFRIKGVGEEYADLLEACGVDSVPELAQRNADNLYAKLKTVNDEKRLTRQLPSEANIAQWIDHAKTLPRMVSH
jgi:predicted flap endonuclease-1-like 5' DNA nuclease